MHVTDNQSWISKPKIVHWKCIKYAKNDFKIIHLRSFLFMPGSGVAMAICLWSPSCLQSCFSIQQWTVASRFEVAPPCRELITWRNEQALAVPEKCLGEQRLLGRVRMQQLSTSSKIFFCNFGQSRKLLHIVQYCRKQVVENWKALDVCCSSDYDKIQYATCLARTS